MVLGSRLGSDVERLLGGGTGGGGSFADGGAPDGGGGGAAFGGGVKSRSLHGPQLPEVSAVGAEGLGGGYFGVAALVAAV